MHLNFVLLSLMALPCQADFGCWINNYGYRRDTLVTQSCGWYSTGYKPYCTPCPTGADVWCPGIERPDGYTDYALCGDCNRGRYYVPNVCGGCSGPICNPCPPNYFCMGGRLDPMPCTACNSSQFAAYPCNATHDTVCEDCSACLSDEFVAYPCNATHDTVCEKCSKCSPESFKVKACNVTGDTECMLCPSDSVSSSENATSYLDCACKPGFYGRVLSPTESTCRPCPADKFCPGPTIARKVCPCSTHP